MFSPLVVTCMFGRPKVSDIFLENMQRLQLPVLSAVSDMESEMVCVKSFNTAWKQYANEPLGTKWNNVIDLSLSYEGWSHLIISGDDDIYSSLFIDRVEEYQDHPFLGLNGVYMIDPKDRHALEFRYKSDVAIGTGRVLHRKVIEQMVNFGGIFDASLNRELDYSADMRLFENNYRPFIIDSDKTLVTDIKTKMNVWPLKNFTDIAPVVNYEKAVAHFSVNERRMVDAL